MEGSRKVLAAAVVNWLVAQAASTGEDSRREALEVAAACVSDALSVTPELRRQPDVPDLAMLTSNGSASKNATSPASPGGNSAAAEACKDEGNEHLRHGRALEAAQAYTRAISHDPQCAVYYCNRAAALTRLADYAGALADCDAAVSLSPRYAKAWGRMGAVHAAQGNAEGAREAYEKALAIEPENTTYAAEIARLSGREQGLDRADHEPNAASGMPDLSALMSNPALMDMASKMMSDPEALKRAMSDPRVAQMMQGMLPPRK